MKSARQAAALCVALSVFARFSPADEKSLDPQVVKIMNEVSEDRIKTIIGHIDLVHCNDSKDAPGSGRDRHANLGSGQIDTELLVAAVKAADAPVICETAEEGRKDDIAFLREKTSGRPSRPDCGARQ